MPGFRIYPPVPAPTGEAQVAFAGEVTDGSQLVTGPAQSGLVGDYFIKNDQVTFIVQAPTRVIGVIPQGGNVVDAVLTDGTHQTVDDHFGELGLIYLLGRTCEPDHIDIVRDGSEGGVAVLRAVGKSGNDDFLDIKGIGALPVDPRWIPSTTTASSARPRTSSRRARRRSRSGTRCSTPARTRSTARWARSPTPAATPRRGHNARGFERADISALATLSVPEPSDYVVYQGPGVAYGVIPRHNQPTVHAQALVAGV